MIFITVGSQKFQFNRLLKEIDDIIETGKFNKDIFAQTGYSDYEPKNYQFKKFIDREEFKKIMLKSDVIISHGGTGIIVNAIKQGKKVIAIPRLSKYGEHVDDHQMQLVKEFESSGFIKAVYEINELKDILEEIDKMKFKKYESNTEKIIQSIEDFIGE